MNVTVEERYGPVEVQRVRRMGDGAEGMVETWDVYCSRCEMANEDPLPGVALGLVEARECAQEHEAAHESALEQAAARG